MTRRRDPCFKYFLPLKIRVEKGIFYFMKSDINRDKDTTSLRVITLIYWD